jgi:hypothetical protein
LKSAQSIRVIVVDDVADGDGPLLTGHQSVDELHRLLLVPEAARLGRQRLVSGLEFGALGFDLRDPGLDVRPGFRFLLERALPTAELFQPGVDASDVLLLDVMDFISPFVGLLDESFQLRGKLRGVRGQ